MRALLLCLLIAGCASVPIRQDLGVPTTLMAGVGNRMQSHAIINSGNGLRIVFDQHLVEIPAVLLNGRQLADGNVHENWLTFWIGGEAVQTIVVTWADGQQDFYPERPERRPDLREVIKIADLFHDPNATVGPYAGGFVIGGERWLLMMLPFPNHVDSDSVSWWIPDPVVWAWADSLRQANEADSP